MKISSISCDEASLASDLRRWLFEFCLPHWVKNGFTQFGLAAEGTDFHGTPTGTSTRTMVQFRQCYVFARAAEFGACDPDISEQLFRRVRDFAWDDERGWAHRLTLDGRVADPSRDLYDHAFALLAAASVYRVSGQQEVIDQARATLRFLDLNMSHRSGGFCEAIPRASVPRRQNPHMHLFEGLLALYEATGDAFFLSRALRTYELLLQKFLDKHGVLREFFNEDLTQLNSQEGQTVEPGHQYEWVWLLHELNNLSGTPVDQPMASLFSFADCHGHADNGLIYEAIGPDGTVTSKRKKLWAQMEYVKASLVMGGHAPKAVRQLEHFLGLFLPSRSATVWYECLDQDNAPIRDRMPTSTLYHIVSGLLEFLLRRGHLARPPSLIARGKK